MTAASLKDGHIVELRLLGAFRAIDESSGEDLTPRGKKARALLAYLALSENGRVTRERAAALLWSDRGPEQARVSLRQSLAELRSSHPILAGLVIADREKITISDRVRTDIGHIVESDRAGNIEGFARRLEAYQGEFLDDLYGLSPGFDDWLLFERPRRRDLLLSAALRVAVAALEKEDTSGLRSILAALERIDPANEHVTRLGMTADRRIGDLASLHRRYRRLADVLKREFEAQPSEETRRTFYELTRLSTELEISPNGAGSTKGETSSAPPVIIVSSLRAIDRDADTGLLASICTDEIKTALARHRDLRVIPIDQPDLERIERVCASASASYLLSGTLRDALDGLRCNVQLSLAATGLVLWSDQLVVSDATIEEAIERIVSRTVGAVAPVIERDLTGYVPAELPSASTLLLYARARRQLYQAGDYATLLSTAKQLERVVAVDAGHVNARLLLAQLYNTDFFQQVAGHDPTAARLRAFELARQAAALDPENPAAQLRLAWCFLRRGDWDDATDRFENAAELARFDSLVLNEAGFGFCHAGDLEAAERLIRRAFQQNPFPPSDFHADLAVLLALKGDARGAEEQFEASSETALHYLAVRLVNLWQGSRTSSAELAETLRRRFGAVWAGATSWTNGDLIDWIETYLPLRDASARQWLRQGLTRALAQRDSAAHDIG